MIGIYPLKPWFLRRLRSLEDRLVARRVSPTTLSWAAVVVSVAAGVAFAGGAALHRPLLWLVVPPLALIRLALNALDGAVARRTGSATPFGMAVNEIGDRVCDVALLSPLAVVVDPTLVTTAVAGSFLTSIVGLTASVVTGRRATSGSMGKADRMLVLAAAVTVAAITGSEQVLHLSVWLIVLGTALTTLSRLHALRAEVTDVPLR